VKIFIVHEYWQMISCPPPIARKPAESAGFFYVLSVSDHTMTIQMYLTLFPTRAIPI